MLVALATISVAISSPADEFNINEYVNFIY